MPQPGWYPDPARTPGRFRYWDGQSWSAETSANPGGPPPRAGGPRGRGGGRRGLLIGGAALVVVLIVVAVFVVRALSAPRPVTDDPVPSSTVVGGDDRSPTPTPEAPSPSPSPTPTPTPSAASQPPMTACPYGDPQARDQHPNDGRIHGGGLSFPSQPGWDDAYLTQGLSWTYDTAGQQKAVEPEWYAMFAVGALSTVDGFETPERSAEDVMQCTATTDFYTGFTGRKDVFSKPITVAGHQGWALRSEIRVKDQHTTLPGDVVEVIVVDLGSPESLAMFWGAVPIGDQKLIAQLDKAIADLRQG